MYYDRKEESLRRKRIKVESPGEAEVEALADGVGVKHRVLNACSMFKNYVTKILFIVLVN